ncbi:MAG: type II secretion system protein [Phycisphaerales bacterium]|nr:type II secretion system protein [Phycisphaerales bacterium]
MTKTTRSGISLVELLVSVVMLATLSITILPALASVRDASENEMSRANLMALGQARDQYALDHKDRIFSYTWRAGESYTMPDGRTRTANDDQEAASNQNTEILMRRTGRISGINKIRTAFNRLPHRRFSHLVLLDYMADTNEVFNESTVAIDPADDQLLTWHERPLTYTSGSGVPYSDNMPQGYDDDFNWVGIENKMRWAFASSYQVVPYAWQGDGPTNIYVPVADTPHLYSVNGSPVMLGRRSMTEVAFPSQKVHMHEEFDYEQPRYPYFAYDHAVPEKLMFDGSINSRPSGEANDADNPADPSPVWRQRYVPLDTFPIPLGGLGDPTELNMRYRWTEGGLQGVDYD